LFWDESIDVELLKINSRVIDVMIHDQQKNMKWRSTFVYGEPCRHQRYLMWDLLKNETYAKCSMAYVGRLQ
jgi:hypothetical protein